MELTGKELSSEKALELIEQEFDNANKKFPLFSSKHEGYAVLKEEVDEFWESIKTKGTQDTTIQYECIQVAAMALKFLVSPIY